MEAKVTGEVTVEDVVMDKALPFVSIVGLLNLAIRFSRFSKPKKLEYYNIGP